MTDQEKLRAGLDRAKAVDAWEDREFDKSLSTPRWNHKHSAWIRPMGASGGFGPEEKSLARTKPPLPAPNEFDENIAEFDEAGRMTVRNLPDCEHIDPSELYDFTQAERFQYARNAQTTYYDICERETGRSGDADRLHAEWSERDELKSQTHLIAARIENASRREADFTGDESLFVPMYRETEYGIYTYYLFSKIRTQAPKFRNSCFLPYMASQKRGKLLKSLESFLENNPFARMWTFTSGERVGLDGIRKRTKSLHRNLSKLNHFLRKELGIEMVFRATEYGTPEGGTTNGEFERDENGKVTFHVHAHCLIRILGDKPFSKERWSQTLEEVWKFWGFHWDDGKSVQNVRELCKYVSKPQALLSLADWELLRLYRETNTLHLVQTMGTLRDDIRSRKERKMRLEYVETPDGKVLSEVPDWNAHRDAEKDAFQEAFEGEEKALNKLEALFNGTEGNAEPEIRILSKSVPGFAPGSLLKEPRIIVMMPDIREPLEGSQPSNATLKRIRDLEASMWRAVDSHPIVQEIRRRTWEQWAAGQQLTAAIRVHTGAITVQTKSGQSSWLDIEYPPPDPGQPVELYDFHTECTPI